MKRDYLLLVCAGLVVSSTWAAPVNPNDLAAQWRKTPSSERFEYAKRATYACMSRNCGSVEIKACIDEVVRPPLSRAIERMTIGELAAGCIAMLKAQS